MKRGVGGGGGYSLGIRITHSGDFSPFERGVWRRAVLTGYRNKTDLLDPVSVKHQIPNV